MSRNLIIYKVEYNLKSDPWDYGNDKFKRVKRMVMTPDEVDQIDGYWRNHARVERKFFKQMDGIEGDTYNSRYRIRRINKA
jgi:hypothetical protein